jgi:hypothetical protein
MASLEVERDELVVRLSAFEQVAAARHEVRVPRRCVTCICVEPDPWSALRGVRAPGTGIPGIVAYGVRRLTGRRPDFAALHGRDPAVRVELGSGARFARLVVSVDDPAATVAACRPAAPADGTDPVAPGLPG